MLPYNKKYVGIAQALRKNMTPEERHLWYDFLKRLPTEVKRQHNIENYIVDFYIAKSKIVIEVDGVQHSAPEQQQKDRERDAMLTSWGITVLRYTNNAIRYHFDAVANDILWRLGFSFGDLKDPR